jgi:hypothetical protein
MHRFEILGKGWSAGADLHEMHLLISLFRKSQHAHPIVNNECR